MGFLSVWTHTDNVSEWLLGSHFNPPFKIIFVIFSISNCCKISNVLSLMGVLKIHMRYQKFSNYVQYLGISWK